jgi:gamma-tubulin complex component 4
MNRVGGGGRDASKISLVTRLLLPRYFINPLPISSHIRGASMLAEVLLVLGGHPSAFFVPEPPSPARPTTLTTSPHLAKYLHPGELSSLDTLARLAFRYRKVRDWAASTRQRGRDALLAEMTAERGRGRSKGKEKAQIQQGDQGVESGPGVYLSTLASALLDVLREYDLAIVSVEAKILSLDPELVQDSKGYVPLSSVVATFDPWQAPLAALERMVDTLSSDSSLLDSTWSPGKVIELLHQSTQTGNPRLQSIFTALLSSIETLWLTHLSAFLLFGDAPSSSSRSSPAIALDVGADPLSPQHRVYKLDEDMFPTSVTARTRESILYVGRVASTLRRESRTLPAELVESLRDEVMRAGMGDGLEIAIGTARAEVGE